MEFLLTQQNLLIAVLKLLLAIGCFVLVVILGFYNALYLSRLLNSRRQIGLHPPRHIHNLVRMSIYIPLFTAVFIIFFLLMGLY